MCSDSSRQGGNKEGVPQIEVTPEMIEAGANRFGDLVDAGVGSAYAAAEIYLAMDAARAPLALAPSSQGGSLRREYKWLRRILEWCRCRQLQIG